MTWIRVRVDGATRVGLIDGPDVILSEASEVAEVLGSGTPAGPRVPLVEVSELAIVDSPPSIRDFMSYEQHVQTLRRARGAQVPPVWYEQPSFYFSNPAAVVGPNDPVPISPGSSNFDYEVEIAVIISQPGSDIPVHEAARFIAGYSLMCDWSARDLQLREYAIGLGPAKAKDSATTIGSRLVTPEEWKRDLIDAGATITVRIDGRLHTSTDVREPNWSFEQMISYASRGTRLRTGDVIGSGTLGGGCLWELRSAGDADDHPWLQAGNVVEIDAGLLGTARTLLTPAVPPSPLGRPTQRSLQ
jgi:2-keto-4-pentenoate hydratase/2-oxohepta-3-ene-1,7-dioic acid hydratase in catechol pathway